MIILSEKDYAALGELLTPLCERIVNNRAENRYGKAKNRLDDVESQLVGKKSRKAMMEKFLADLAAQDGVLTEFDEGGLDGFLGLCHGRG